MPGSANQKRRDLKSASLERSSRKEPTRERARTARSTRRRRGSAADQEDKEEERIVLTPWEAFQEQIRLIDDNTAMYSIKEGKAEADKDKAATEEVVQLSPEQQAQQIVGSMKHKSSDAFSKVMYEFALRKQQHAEKMAALQRERERRAQEERAGGEVEEELEEDDDLDSDWSDDDVEEPKEDAKALELRKSATRAWGIIRRRVNEMRMEKKNNGTALNWNFLRQTLAHMTDMEKGRQTLYEKYLDKPHAWKEGFVNFPQELFNKERSKGRRAHVSPPSPKSKSRRPQKGKDSDSVRSKGVKSH